MAFSIRHMDVLDKGLEPRIDGPDHKARSGMPQPERSNKLDTMDHRGCTLIWEDAQKASSLLRPYKFRVACFAHCFLEDGDSMVPPQALPAKDANLGDQHIHPDGFEILVIFRRSVSRFRTSESATSP